MIILGKSLKAAIHLGPNHIENTEVSKNHKLRVTSEFIGYHSAVGIASSSGDSECEKQLIGQLPHGRDLQFLTIR